MITAAQAQATRAFIEDVEWLVATGETHVERVAARLGTNPRAIEKRLWRAGRGDLARRLSGLYVEAP